jgi:transcriptional regulator with XRE-family HTH domain
MFETVMEEERKAMRLTQAQFADLIRVEERTYRGYVSKEARTPMKLETKLYIVKKIRSVNLLIAFLHDLDLPFTAKMLNEDPHHVYQTFRGKKENCEAERALDALNPCAPDLRLVENAMTETNDVLVYGPNVEAALSKAYNISVFDLYERHMKVLRAQGKLREEDEE